jgi:hypothetical protein
MKALEFPLSSIAAERTFAIARKIDMPSRASQTWETFSREVYVRINKAFTLNALERALVAYKASMA